MTMPQRLLDIAGEVKRGKTPEKETVRNFLSWFGAQRRGYYIVQLIRQALAECSIRTEPDFESAYIDSYISFMPATSEERPVEGSLNVTLAPLKLDATGKISVDPTNRIGKLPSANTVPTSVKPDSTLQEIVTIMLSRDFSQLPVMTTERDVKGMVGWNTIGSRVALGKECKTARDCMEPHYEITSDTSLFDAIDFIIDHEYVLIRDAERKISGIVTTSDLSQQFRKLGEPFLLLGEIENHIRRLIDGKFTLEQIQAARDPSEPERRVTSVSDLAFGEYLRLLENPERWNSLGLAIDRGVFVVQLDKIRQIRNDVMHFDPDGPADSDLQTLREFVQFLQGLRQIGVT